MVLVASGEVMGHSRAGVQSGLRTCVSPGLLRPLNEPRRGQLWQCLLRQAQCRATRNADVMPRCRDGESASASTCSCFTHSPPPARVRGSAALLPVLLLRPPPRCTRSPVLPSAHLVNPVPATHTPLRTCGRVPRPRRMPDRMPCFSWRWYASPSEATST